MKKRAAIAAALAGIMTVVVWAQSRPAPPATVVPGRSKIATRYGIVAAQPAAGRARRRPGPRARRQRHRRRDCGQRRDGTRRARDERHRRRPVRDRLRGEHEEALRPERRRLGADGLTPALLRSKGLTSMPRTRHLLRDRARRRRRMGRVARRGSARCRCPTCWRRRFSTPTNGFPVTDIIAQGWAGSAAKLAADEHRRSCTSPAAAHRRPARCSGTPNWRATLRLVARKRRGRFLRRQNRRRHPRASRVSSAAP